MPRFSPMVSEWSTTRPQAPRPNSIIYPSFWRYRTMLDVIIFLYKSIIILIILIIIFVRAKLHSPCDQPGLNHPARAPQPGLAVLWFVHPGWAPLPRNGALQPGLARPANPGIKTVLFDMVGESGRGLGLGGWTPLGWAQLGRELRTMLFMTDIPHRVSLWSNTRRLEHMLWHIYLVILWPLWRSCSGIRVFFKSMATVGSVYKIKDKHLIQYFPHVNISFGSTHPLSMFICQWSMIYVTCYMFYVWIALVWCNHRSPFFMDCVGFEDLSLCSNIVLTYFHVILYPTIEFKPSLPTHEYDWSVFLSVFSYRHFLGFDLLFQFFTVNSVLIVVFIDSGGFLAISDSNQMHDTNAFANTNANVT